MCVYLHAVIRCGERIYSGMVDNETKFPCLLPKKRPLTTLTVHRILIRYTFIQETRAIHREIVNDLSIDILMQALRRFTARRSLARIILSDNVSTYEAAVFELARLINSDRLRINQMILTLGGKLERSFCCC